MKQNNTFIKIFLNLIIYIIIFKKGCFTKILIPNTLGILSTFINVGVYKSVCMSVGQRSFLEMVTRASHAVILGFYDKYSDYLKSDDLSL